MENLNVVNSVSELTNSRTRSNLNIRPSINRLHPLNDALEVLMTEGGENFYNYVYRRGLTEDPSIVVLSSQHHYYYDAEEMNSVNTVVNLKELNQIKQIKSFLNSSLRILPQKSNFIGCFVDNKKTNGYALRNNISAMHDRKSFEALEHNIVSGVPFLNMIYGIMDSKTNNYMTTDNVALMLERYGCRVVDMTETRDLTYFHAKKIRANYN